MGIRDINVIRERLSVLPSNMHRRALEVLDSSDELKRSMNCAVVSRYTCGYLNTLSPRGNELLGFYFNLGLRADTQNVIMDTRPGDLAVFGGSMDFGTLPDEHYAVVLDGESLFSMIGQGGPLSVDTIDETFEIFRGVDDLNVDTVQFFRNLRCR